MEKSCDAKAAATAGEVRRQPELDYELVGVLTGGRRRRERERVVSLRSGSPCPLSPASSSVLLLVALDYGQSTALIHGASAASRRRTGGIALDASFRRCKRR